MSRDFVQDATERADPKAGMIGNRDMMFAAALRREPHVTARFSSDRVPVTMQRPRERTPRNIAR